MSTTQSSHEPSSDELAHSATDGGHHPSGIAAEVHGPADPTGTDGRDDHAHDGEMLGPVDIRVWGALALGVAAGLLVALCLVITTVLLKSATPAA